MKLVSSICNKFRESSGLPGRPTLTSVAGQSKRFFDSGRVAAEVRTFIEEQCRRDPDSSRAAVEARSRVAQRPRRGPDSREAGVSQESRLVTKPCRVRGCDADSSRAAAEQESPARKCREEPPHEAESRQGRHPGCQAIRAHHPLCTSGVLRVLCGAFASFAVSAFIFLLGPWAALPALAQHHADLAPAEVGQLRDAALDPDQRLKLYLKFARARLAALDQIRTDPKTAPSDRPTQIHDHLQDFLNLFDELDDNIDMYVDRKEDIRKPLKAVIEADTEFQTKIRAFQDALQTAKEDTKPYEFVLSNLQDTLTSAAADHRQLMAEQEEAAKHAKKHRQQKQ